ncbi:MAG: LexA binding domain [Pseudomonadota bacterium]|jgi:SOS-response transcriptional repressor LexA
MEMRAPRELGYRGRQVLAFVRDCIDSEGAAPSYTMIRDRLGFNDRAEVCRVVARLEGRGLIARAGNGRVRRIRLPAYA